jgi:rhodanese-related sulfurtransferase
MKAKTLKKAPKPANNQRQIWLIGGALVLLVVAAALVIASLRSPQAVQALPAEITVAQAYQKYQEGAFLLDVRTQEEWDAVHAPNTTLIPLDQLPNRLAEVPRDQEIVVVCRSGNRSREGRDILLNAGFAQVTSMSAGLNEWRSAGYPVVSGP